MDLQCVKVWFGRKVLSICICFKVMFGTRGRGKLLGKLGLCYKASKLFLGSFCTCLGEGRQSKRLLGLHRKFSRLV